MNQISDERKIQLVKAELEDEENERIVALYYFTAAYLDIVEEKKMISDMERIKEFNFYKETNPDVKQNLFNACMTAASYVEHVRQFLEKKREFFKLDINDEVQRDIKKRLADLNMTEDQYGTLYLCATGKDMKKVCNQIMDRQEPHSDDMDEQKMKNNCNKAVRTALEMYKHGDRKAVRVMIKEGLENASKLFSRSPNAEEAIEWSSVTAEILFICDKDAQLVKDSGINENQMSIARQIASIGNDIRMGLMAAEVLAGAKSAKTTVLTAKQRQAMIEIVEKMNTVLADSQQLAKKWDEPISVPVKTHEKAVPANTSATGHIL